MGSMLSRYLRDLTEVAGCEIISDIPSPELSTPTPPARVLDPRSPTAEICRTPIEVAPFCPGVVEESPSPLSCIRRSYLETDLDSLTTKELASKPEEAGHSEPHASNMAIPSGLSSAHILKLQFLGMDPRSPSSNVIRTPIQVALSGEKEEKNLRKLKFEDSISLGSVSSQEASRNSSCLSDFTREFSDPSVFVSECEDESTEELHSSVAGSTEVCDVGSEAENYICENLKNNKKHNVCNESFESPVKSFAKLTIFCEDDTISAIVKPGTPDHASAKKNVRNKARTPLTPLCNRNITPNSIIRAKQSQVIEREKLTKVKIYNGAEKVKTPSSQAISNKDIAVGSTPNKSDRKLQVMHDENSATPDIAQQIRAQWDLDTSIVI